MIKKILIAFIVFPSIVGAFSLSDIFPWAKAQPQVFGDFSDPFISIQLAPSPSNGNCLTTDGTDNIWSTCASGGGGSGGTWSTTTSQTSGVFINYPNNDDDVVAIGANASTTAEAFFDPNTLFADIFNTALFNGTTASSTLIGSLTLTGNFIFGGDTIDELVGDGLAVSSGDLIFDCSDVAGTGITCSGEDITAEVITAGDALTRTGDDIDFDGGTAPSGELGGTWGSITIDDSIAVSSWNLTTPTLTSFFGTACTGNNFLQDIGDTGTFSCAEATGGTGSSHWATSTAGDSIIPAGAIKVGIGTTTPFSTLSVSTTSANALNLPLFTVASSTHESLFQVLSGGDVKIGGGTPQISFDGTLGSTTLQNFTFRNATGTTATTTNFFSDFISFTSLLFDSEVFDSLTDDATLDNNGGDLRVVDVTCTNCLTTTEVASADLATLATNVSDADFGDLTVVGGVWGVEDDSHAHTGGTLSGIDISGDTNLTAGDNLTLTDDDLDLDTTLTGLVKLTFQYSSSTDYSSFVTASTTNLTGGFISGFGLSDCDADGATVSWDATTQRFGCGDDDNSGGSGGFDFSYVQDIGYGVTGSATTTKTKFTLGLHASSTNFFDYASTTALTVNGLTTLLGNLTFDSEIFDSLTDDATLANNSGDLQVVDVTCTDCLSSTETDSTVAISARNLTIAGTSQQITSSAGAQDLSADRTWTLSLPSHVVFPGNFQATRSTTTHATSTNHDITGLLTFGGVTGSAWSSFCVSITGSASLCDGSDADSGGSTAWDAIGNPSGAGAVVMAETVQSLDWDTGAVASLGVDYFTLTATNDAATDVLTQRLAVIQNKAGANGLENLLVLDNADTDDVVVDGLEIISAAGGITNALDVDDAEIVNALIAGANNLSGTNWSITGATGLGTFGHLTISTTTPGFLKISSSGVVYSATSTRSISLFKGASLTPDTGGNSWFEPYSITSTNDNFLHLVGIASSTAAKTGFYGSAYIPNDYNNGCSVTVVWTTPATTGDAVFDFAYRGIGGDDSESLDQATFVETVTVTDTAPSAVDERNKASVPLTCSNLAGDDTLEFYISRDGADAADTLVKDVVIHDVIFNYSD